MYMMRLYRLAVLALSLALPLAACSRSATTTPNIDVQPEDAALGPGDVFLVRVFGQEDLSGNYRVDSDGTIHFPFLGSLQVTGRDPQQVADDIAAGLRSGGYLKQPQVSVLVTDYNSKRITLIGAVAKPGTLPLVPGITLVQAISQAGGFTPLASKDDTVVTRRVNGKLERYRITITEVTRGNAEDLPLRAGDIVFVPERVF